MIFLSNIPLAQYTTYKIGGQAKHFAEAHNEFDIVRILDAYNLYAPYDKKVFILGGGANVLFPDEGYDGLVLKISMSDIELIDNEIIFAGAGASLKNIILFAAEHGLTGLEWAAGIPGSLGGAIRGNAGAFGREMKDSIISVRSVKIQDSRKIIERVNTELMFNYRTSVFKSIAQDEIILSSKIQLAVGKTEDIKNKIEQNIKYRKENQPSEPSAGSTFKNIDIVNITEEQKKQWERIIKTDPKPVMPVAFIISEAGLKGTMVGDAKISEKHSNFFINTGKATAKDIRELIAIAKKTIKEKFNIEIEEEIQIVSG